MHFDWPTPEQMMYRIIRLRRLIVVAVGIPVCVILVMGLVDPLFVSPNRAMFGAIAVAFVIAAHVVLFPNVTLETLSLSLALALLVPALSWVSPLAGRFPVENMQAASVLLVVCALMCAGAAMVLIEVLLTGVIFAGPAVPWRLRVSMDIACSASVAHRQFALQPHMRRGRVLSGPADSDGLFDVAIVAPQVADPDQPDQPFVARITAKVLQSDATSHQVMLVLGDGSVATTSQCFTPTTGGCRVEIMEMPGDFTYGMHLMFWLADQQADDLTEVADVILSQPARANGLAHGVSFLSIAATVLSPRSPAAGRAK